MKRYFEYVSLIPMVACGSAIASGVEVRDAIPEQFWGKWASKSENCFENHVQSVEIGPTSLEFSKSSGIPISIVLRDQKELALIVEFTADGNEWVGFVHYEISDDGKMLADILNTYAGNGFTRIKCQ